MATFPDNFHGLAKFDGKVSSVVVNLTNFLLPLQAE